MGIVSLFCKIDDFFYPTKHTWHRTRSRTVNPRKPAGVREVYIPAR